MHDHDEHMMGSSPQGANSQPAANRAGEHGTGASHDAQHPGGTAAVRTVGEEPSLSRTWGGAGIPVSITLAAREARRLHDCRVLWGLPHGGDGFSLLRFERADNAHTTTLSFNVPAHALPGIYAVQLQNGNEFRHRLQFAVTTHEPPETSPFKMLRTDPANGTMRMYLTFDRHRATPAKAVEEIAKLLKTYDTFFAPPADDPSFQEILDESLTQDEKREKFATWLVKNQLAAEE